MIDINILQILSGCQTPELSIPWRTVILEMWRGDIYIHAVIIYRKICITLHMLYNMLLKCNKVDMIQVS